MERWFAIKGGEGSGNYGHGGRPGEVGGSGEGGGDKKVSSEMATINSDSKSINSVEMNHYTTKEAADKIKEEGFKVSDNSMYGEGVYFTNDSASVYTNANEKINIGLIEHNQAVIARDIDVPKFYKEQLGSDANKSSSDVRKLMVKKGWGSIRFGYDENTYVLVLDPKLIKIK